MIGTRVGNYEIKAKIGEGGMGAVYLGEHPLIGRRVAIKVLLEEFVANEGIATRFFNEAKAANDIRHQNIVEIVDFGRTPKEGGGHIVYIMMELLEGESLSTRTQRLPLTFAETQYILTQCCSGLAASHAKGIIHRDLKPDNLYLIRRGADHNFLKILDFGIAKLTAAANNNAKTRTGTLMGTPSYMSPEQCAGRGKIDARSDIYSLGIVAYEMLTGRLPFIGEGFGDIVVAHITEAPKPLTHFRPDLPLEWEAVVMRAIEKDPDKRFQSMEEMGVALADPAAYVRNPHAAAVAGAVAAAQTTAVPVVSDLSGARPLPAPPSSAQPTVQARKTTNTTLSGAAAEVRPPSRSRRRWAVIGTSAAAVAAAVGVVVLHGSGAAPVHSATVTTPAPVVAAPAAPVKPKAPDDVAVTITSEPPGARVLRSDQGDAVAGVTPLTIKTPKGSAPFEVQLQLDGYRAEKRSIATDVSRELYFAMVKDAPATAAAAPPSAHRKRPSSQKPEDENLKLLPPCSNL